MFNKHVKKPDPDPHQGGAFPAPAPIIEFPQKGACKQTFATSGEKPYAKRLGMEDIDLFLEMHTRVRMSLPEQDRDFMKELKPELLASLFEKNMPVIGIFENGRLVAGCAVLYPEDKDVDAYLKGYDFGANKDRTAVISAVWTHPDHGRKGLGNIAIDFAMNLAALDGKDVFAAKVDTRNKASLALFRKFGFDIEEQGNEQKPVKRKVFPLLAL